jgi:hypothetical protein
MRYNAPPIDAREYNAPPIDAREYYNATCMAARV